jgi:hypothetical protein
MKGRTARLIFTEKCNRKCSYCCNKEFDFDTEKSWKWGMVGKYTEVNITGGEPLLFPMEVKAFIHRFKALDGPPSTKLFLYTAYINDIPEFREILKIVDGITLTLHEQSDVLRFRELNYLLNLSGPFNKSLRLSVFGDIKLPNRPYPLWNIMMNRRPLTECPVPEDDLLVMRYNFER